jgi:ketosteroid isomerase-like protein
MLTHPQLIDLILSSFEAERTSDTEKGLKLLHPDFAVVEMSATSQGEPFTRVTGEEIRNSIREVFQISDREYQFVHTLADEVTQTVMIEFVESYTDPDTGKRFRTPNVSVVEVKDGLIWRSRHYNDKDLSFMHLTQEQIDGALA